MFDRLSSVLCHRIPGSLTGLAVALLLTVSPHADRAVADEANPLAVVELFTSQGCSSCPAADRNLADYVKQGQVLALSWHVDYWNYLGWKDTFSSPAFTERQRRYATSLGRRQIYTPQAIINGRDHALGSSREQIETMINRFNASGQGLTVPISARRKGDQVTVSLQSATASHNNATLWMVYFDRSSSVAIKRGENSGKTITYHNVVRDVQMLGMVKGGQFAVDLPLGEIKRLGHDACAVILQQSSLAGTPGPIIGATVIGDIKG